MDRLLLVLLVASSILVAQGMPRSEDYDYDEENYPEDQEDRENEWEEEGVLRLSMVTKGQTIEGRVGDSVSLPCQVSEKLPNNVEAIWTKVDEEKPISIGQKILTKEEQDQYRVEEGEKGTSLVITKVEFEHAGQYQCRIATINPVQVVHSLSVIASDSTPTALGSSSSSSPSLPSTPLVPLVTSFLLILLSLLF
jgi:hypothetical protein